MTFSNLGFFGFDQLALNGYSLSAAEIESSANLFFEKNDLAIDFSDAKIRLSAISTDNLELKNLDGQLVSSSQLRIPNLGETSPWSIQDGKWEISDLSYSKDNLNGHIEALKLSTDFISSNKYDLDFNGQSIDVNFGDMEDEITQLSGSISTVNPVIKILGELELERIPIRFNYDIDINTSSNESTFAVGQLSPFDIGFNSDNLNAEIARWVPNLTLTGGMIKLDITGDLNNTTGLSSRINIESSDISGNYNEISFTGGKVTGPVHFPPDNESTSATVNVSKLEYGVEIENIEADLRLKLFDTGTKPGIAFDNLSGTTLGSHFESKDFFFDPNIRENHVDLYLTGLDIDQVVSMQQISGLTATGKLDGKLPINIVDDGINIELGEFWNQKKGGTIRYLIDPEQASSLSNPLTDQVLKALEEFHYDLLTATANFKPNGDLLVDFHIEGKSPGLDDDRPVHLNINSEQNVLSLLKSLKYANELGDEIDDKIREKILSEEGIGSSEPQNQ